MPIPVLTTQNRTDPAYTELPFLDLFTVTDQPNVIEYQIWQTQEDTFGYWEVDGVKKAPHQSNPFITLTPTQAQTAKFVVGAYPEVNLQIRARNADGWSLTNSRDMWDPQFSIRIAGVPEVYDPAEGLGIIQVNLTCRCDDKDEFIAWNVTDWTNNLGKIRIVQIVGVLGGDFHPIMPTRTQSEAGVVFAEHYQREPIGQYNCGIHIRPQGSIEGRTVPFTHSPTVFVPGAFADNYKRDLTFPAPGLIINNDDVLHFIANAYSPYVPQPGFFWQENFTVFFEKLP